MSGIAGIWGESNESLVLDMMDKLSHRGPDAQGIHVSKNGILGHRRLSIMDPEGGDQPIYNEDRSVVVVVNGEIYNFPKLRESLRPRHRFCTKSDSETVLHIFEEYGPAMVRRIDGMFALAVADCDGLFLARDPIGIRPLYYGIEDHNGPSNTLYFASEIKALLSLGVEVHEFPPGTGYHSDKGFIPYYRISSRAPREMPFELRVRIIRQILEEAIVKRLMSDVPLGIFLSGGLDSSVVAAIARRHMNELHTFSVGIEGSPDIEAARVVARHIGSTHYEYLYTGQEVLAKLPEIIYHLESFDQDLVRGAIPCYFCSRLAADHVKVVLTGEGGDELFAGYTYYKEIHDPETLHRELHRSVTALHNIGLQRLDRMTMAHGVEGRVPFLDVAMIEMGQTIPPELKIHDDGSGRRVEKWILRKACEDLLPYEIVWRDKEQFDEGSGTVALLGELLGGTTIGFDTEAYIQTHSDDRLRSAEEAYYHKTLVDLFGDSRAILDNVGRWQDREPVTPMNPTWS